MSSSTWLHVRNAFGRLNEPSLGSLRRVWLDDAADWRARDEVFGHLMRRHEYGDARVVDLLLEALGEPRHGRVHADAARALGAIRERRAVPSLIALLERRGPEDVNARAAAAAALAELSAAEAVPALVDALGWELANTGLRRPRRR